MKRDPDALYDWRYFYALPFVFAIYAVGVLLFWPTKEVNPSHTKTGFVISAVPSVPPTTAPSTTTFTATTVATSTTTAAPPKPMYGQARASTYGTESGSRTANGEFFDGTSVTFAHKSMAFGAHVEFCYRGRCVIARCNDRGPFIRGRDFDLSTATANAIGFRGVDTIQWRQV